VATIRSRNEPARIDRAIVDRNDGITNLNQGEEPKNAEREVMAVRTVCTRRPGAERTMAGDRGDLGRLGTATDFEERYLAPLEPAVDAAINGMQKFAEVLDQVRVIVPTGVSHCEA